MQLLLETLDLTDGTRHIQSYDFGRPRLSASAAAHDAAGNHPFGFPGDRHDDVEFTLDVIVSGASAAAVEANVSDMLALCQPGARFTLTPGEATGSRTTFARTWTEPRIVHEGSWAVVTLAGTRCPYWHGAQVDTADVELVDTGGSVDIVCEGDVPALTRYYVDGPGSGVVLAAFPADGDLVPRATEDATVTLTNANAWYTLATRTLVEAAYDGSFLGVARMTTPAAATTKVRLLVTTGGIEDPGDYSIAANPGSAEAVAIGPAIVPATGWARDYPETTVELQASCSVPGEDVSLEDWWLLPAPCPQNAGAIAVHAGGSMVLDGLPEGEPNVYGWDYATSSILGSELADTVLLGWPMLRPGTTTVHVIFGTGTGGHLRVSHVPRYLLPA